LRAAHRRRVGWVPQQRLTDPLAENARLAARGAQHDPRGLAPVAGAALGGQAALGAVERERHAVRGLERDAPEARGAEVVDGLELERHLELAGAGPAVPAAALLHERARLPAEPRR